MTDPEEVVRLVAQKHGSGYRTNDPFMIQVTVTNKIIQDATGELAEFMQEQMELLGNRIQEITLEADLDTRSKLQKALNDVLAIANDRVSQVLTKGQDLLLNSVTEKLNTVMNEYEAKIRELQAELRHEKKIMWVTMILLLLMDALLIRTRG